MTKSNTALIPAVVVTLVLHVAVVAAVRNRPLAVIDQSMLASQRRPFVVTRVMDDPVLQQYEAAETAAAEERDAASAADAGALSDKLLQSGDPAPDAVPTMIASTVPIGDELRPDTLAFALPDVDLPDVESGYLVASLNLEVGYVPEMPLFGTQGGVGGRITNDRGATGGEPGAAASAAISESPPGAAELAQQLLADTNADAPNDGGARSDIADTFAFGEIASDRDVRANQRDAIDVNVALPMPTIDLLDQALTEPTEMLMLEHLDEDFTYDLTVHQARSGKRFFRLHITPQRSISKLRTMSKDVVFLIDTSESIDQAWVNQVSRGVGDALGSLNGSGDRFNIVLFKDSVRIFSDTMAPVSDASTHNAMRFLRGAESFGYTDVNRVLSQLIVRDIGVDRVYDLVLISDGRPTRGVKDTAELINLITRDNNLTAGIYCVGIGEKQNRKLLEYMAYRNKGFCVFVDDLTQCAQTIRDVMSRLRYPILKNVSMRVAGLEDDDQIFPRNLPDLHQGQSLTLFGTFGRPMEFTVRIFGQNGALPVDLTVKRDLRNGGSGDESVARGWAFWKMHDLYSQKIQGDDSRSITRQLRELQKQFDLKSLY